MLATFFLIYLEIEYEYDENGFLKRLTLAEETESHKIIENFMLVANEYVATRLSQTALQQFTVFITTQILTKAGTA